MVSLDLFVFIQIVFFCNRRSTTMLLFLVLSAAALSVVRAQEDEPAPAQNDARMAALMSVMNMMNMPPVVRSEWWCVCKVKGRML